MKYILTLTLVALALPALAQTPGHEGHDHHEHRNEFGLANMAVYLASEGEVAPGWHAHWVRYLGHSDFGVGMGYEIVLDDHRHQNLSVVGSYRITDAWSITAAPGISLHENWQQDVSLGLHLETAYEWDWGPFHIGPMLELAFGNAEDTHYSVGLHIGYGF